MAQFDAGIGGGKMPVNGSLFLVALGFKAPNSQIELGGVGNAWVEGTRRQNTQFNFSHVEPRAMFGGVVKAQARENASGLSRLKSLIQRSGGVRIEIVQDQMNTAPIGIYGFDQPLHGVGQILGSTLLGRVDWSPGDQRLKKNEKIAPAVTLILEILLCHASRCGSASLIPL